MNGSASSSWMNNFSHLYVEHAAFDYPHTQQLIARFDRAQVIPIGDYKSVFARPRQHFQTQKRSVKLILAVKKDHFIYPGSGRSQSFGFENFYYNALMLNCLYNCDYCYLQGMYPSANIVVFVNLEDYFTATRQAIADLPDPHQPLYLCISYDTDLLAFERVIPYCSAWIDFVKQQPRLLIEIRTKSALYRAIRHLPPTDRVILAWTLSPDVVADRYETGAPPLRQRLQAIREAIEDGWSVRLCFDPVLKIPDWQTHYGALIEDTFEQIPAERIRDAAIGVFRMSTGYFDRIKKQRHDSDLLYYPYERQDGTLTYPAAQRSEIVDHMRRHLGQYLPEEEIAVWV